jgi:two-component system, OmpR family, phosphate regulon sensor histidine kinase PhoR
LVFALLFVVTVMLERSLGADLQSERDERLVRQARGSTEWASSGRHPHRVASRLAAIVQADVTIYDGNGCVIGTSADGDDLVIERHGCDPPPEIAAARAEGIGRATRPLGDDRFNYVAVPADDGLVVRLGVSSREIEKPLAAMRARLVIAAAAAAAAALVLGLLASLLVARPLRTMAAEADRIARGDYEVTFPPLPKDEFGQLADSLKSLAKQLAADMDRIRRLEITRRDFVANVTHELRTPIAAISGYAETLASGQVEPAKASQFADMMFRHAQRISALVDGLLRLAELDVASSDDPPRDAVDLFAIARDVAETLASRAREADVTVVVEVPREVRALGDATRVEQVIENLVDNAIKYGKEGGRVVISARSTDEAVEISVTDDGPGIDTEHRERVFERFYRVDVGRSREKGGAGLGLAIVTHLVESMGGSIRLEGAENGGAAFIVELDRVASGSKR